MNRISIHCTLLGVLLLGLAPALRAETSSERLKPLVVKIGPALVLFDGADGDPNPTGQARAAVLKADFQGRRTNASTEGQRAKFDAAIAVCDAIIKAARERMETKARADASGDFHGKGKMGSTKKGPKGNEKFFAGHIKADWKNRKAELLEEINTAYARLKEIEAQVQ